MNGSSADDIDLQTVDRLIEVIGEFASHQSTFLTRCQQLAGLEPRRRKPEPAVEFRERYVVMQHDRPDAPAQLIGVVLQGHDQDPAPLMNAFAGQ